MATVIEGSFQEHLASKQLQNVRRRLLVFSCLLGCAAALASVSTVSFRFTWATRMISANSARGYETDASGLPCACTANGWSGEAEVHEIGCSAHNASSDWMWCYVINPEECVEGVASVRYTGAAWVLCSDAQPNHLHELSSTFSPCVLGTVAFALGYTLLGYEPLSRFWGSIVLAVYLSVYECFLWLDIRAFLEYGQVPSYAAEEDRLFQTIAAGAWEVGQAYRLMLASIYVMIMCLNSGLDFLHLMISCNLGVVTFVVAEIVLYVGAMSTVHESINELMMIILLVSTLSTTALWGARLNNRLQRQLFLQTFTLNADVLEKTDAIDMKHTQSTHFPIVPIISCSSLCSVVLSVLALFSNPLASAAQRKVGIRLRPLRLGQEMQHLMRAIPSVYLDIQPSATLEAASAALQQKGPRLVIFSGHTHRGTLAFENDAGALEMTGAAGGAGSFVRMLQKAVLKMGTYSERELQYVFLNACTSLELARLILTSTDLSHLTVICWSTLTADAAARTFAQGFCDALGKELQGLGGSLPEELPVVKAFVAGCRAFETAGYNWGDPADYLHPPDHPHKSTLPADYHSCEGCCPPVQGIALLLRFDLSRGEVVEFCPMPGRGSSLDDLLEASFPASSRLSSRKSSSSVTSFAPYSVGLESRKGSGGGCRPATTSRAHHFRALRELRKKTMRELRKKTMPQLLRAQGTVQTYIPRLRPWLHGVFTASFLILLVVLFILIVLGTRDSLQTSTLFHIA